MMELIKIINDFADALMMRMLTEVRIEQKIYAKWN